MIKPRHVERIKGDLEKLAREFQIPRIAEVDGILEKGCEGNERYSGLRLRVYKKQRELFDSIFREMNKRLENEKLPSFKSSFKEGEKQVIYEICLSVPDELNGFEALKYTHNVFQRARKILDQVIYDRKPKL